MINDQLPTPKLLSSLLVSQKQNNTFDQRLPELSAVSGALDALMLRYSVAKQAAQAVNIGFFNCQRR